MNIPDKFKLHGQTIKVILTNKLVHNSDVVGEARYRDNTILIQDNGEQVNMIISKMEQVFFHELVHYILNAMGEDKINSNDKFVDLFASLLHQAITTFEYDV